MKRIVLLVAVGLSLSYGSHSTFAQCGVERWSVKTGTDADAGLVNLNSTTTTTIANLSSLATPATLPDNNRIAPTETTIWTVNATLREFVRAFDSDYHMVIVDSAGRTMIVEIPAPKCVGLESPFATGIARARQQFEAVFTSGNQFQTANVPVQITGVGFFDYFEGQQGIAPNGIELHPVIDIKFGPFFLTSASPSALTVAQGGIGSTIISSTLSGNFNSSVALSVSGLPPGAAAALTPSTFNAPGSGSSTLTISVASSTPVGTYNVGVTGVGGGQTHPTTINLTVTAGSSTTQQLIVNTGFETGSNPTPWLTTSGVIDNSNFQASHTGAWKAWLNGYGTVRTDTLAQTVGIPSTATQANLSFWLHIDTTETSTTTAYDTLKVQLKNSSGAVLTTLATYSNLDAAAGYKQVSLDVSNYKGQTVQIFVSGIEDSSLKTSFVVDDFALYATTSALPPPGGGTVQMLGNPGFENGSPDPSPWAVTAGVIDNASQPAHGGSWKAWLNGYGVPHTDTLMQSVSIPANATKATLSFWLHIDTSETTRTRSFDTLKLQVRNSAGSAIATLSTYSNLNAAPGYTQVSFDLSAYKGQTIQIYLEGVEDQSLKTSFVVDDFLLNVTTP